MTTPAHITRPVAPATTASPASSTPTLAQRTLSGLKGKGYEAQSAALSPLSPTAPGLTYPRVAVLGTERVNVGSREEEAEAVRILEELKDRYGIVLDSAKSVDAIRAQYTNVPKAVTDLLKTGSWEIKELRALERALACFAPILGDKRKTSSRKDAPQEISGIGKVERAIDENTAAGALDDTTFGEYFPGAANVGMFAAGTGSTTDFADNAKQIKGTVVHEVAHALLAHKRDDWAGRLDFWMDAFTPSGKAGAEAPPTTYGETNAREDLSESVMYFFVDRAAFEVRCPKRVKIVDEYVEEWTPRSEQNTSGPKRKP